MGTLATAQYIADRAVDELGLARTQLVEGLINQVGVQAMALLSSLGEDLVRDHDWQFLEKAVAFQGNGSANIFSLPPDFGRIVNQTVWSEKNKMPASGPVGAKEWGWIKFGMISSSVYYRYRILNDRFEVFPTPPAGERLQFFYISKNWVIKGDGTGYGDSIIDNTDKPMFDRSVMIKGLKARLWAQKGFDTSVLAREYNDALNLIKAQDQGAPEIRLGRYADSELLDGTRNVPEGNW